jgi:Protein of unknown function (DUF3224)
MIKNRLTSAIGRTIAVVGLSSVPLVAASPASAASPLAYGTGTYALTGAVVHSTTQVGDYVVVEQTLSIDNDGVLDGPSVADLTCTFAATGEGVCAGVEQFAGTIGGRSGTATFAVGATVDSAGFHGTFAAVRGDGDLVGLRAYGSFEGGATGTNDLRFGFRP